MLERLELDRMRGGIGDVEPRQDIFRRARIVIGRAAHQRETGQRHHRIDDAAPILHEMRFNGRARIKPAREGRDHAIAGALHHRDHAVIMLRIAASR